MKVVNLNKKAGINSFSSVGVAAIGFGAGQALLSKANKPIADIGALAAGIALGTSANPHVKMAGIGIAMVAGFRAVNRFTTPKNGASPNPIQSLLSKFVPNLAGLGELGELGYALPESPTISYDASGNMMGMDGTDDLLNGEEVREIAGFEGEQDLSGDEDLKGYEEVSSSLM